MILLWNSLGGRSQAFNPVLWLELTKPSSYLNHADDRKAVTMAANGDGLSCNVLHSHLVQHVRKYLGSTTYAGRVGFLDAQAVLQ
jgi:hypothetical protein